MWGRDPYVAQASLVLVLLWMLLDRSRDFRPQIQFSQFSQFSQFPQLYQSGNVLLSAMTGNILSTLSSIKLSIYNITSDGKVVSNL